MIKKKESKKILDSLKVVKIVDSSRTGLNNYQNYLISVVSPKIDVDTGSTDNFIFFPLNSYFPNEQRYKAVAGLKSANHEIYGEGYKVDTVGDGLVLPILFFAELNPEYDYRSDDIINILKIKVI